MTSRRTNATRRPLKRRRVASVPRPRLSIPVTVARRTSHVFRSIAFASANGFAYEFRLGYMPNYTEFTALFDQYRLVKVYVKFIPLQTESAYGSTVPANGYIITSTDEDDANAHTSRDAALSCQTHQINGVCEEFTRVVYPRAAAAVYSGAVSTSYAQTAPDTWFDAANVNTSFYGLKDWVENPGGGPVAWNVFSTCIWQFRKLR